MPCRIVLPGLVTQRYEDVKAFHESVVRNRRDYPTSEPDAAMQRIEQRDAEKSQVDRRRPQVMNLSRAHGVLDNFLKLQAEQSRRVQRKLDDLSIEDYVLPIWLDDSTSDGRLFGIRFG